MQDKLQKLFDEIELNEDNVLSCFYDAKINKVVVYDNNKQIDFIIDTTKVIPIEIYNIVLDKLKTYFKTIKIIPELRRIFTKVNDNKNTL